MTVNSSVNKITYIGSASQTLYPIPFAYIKKEDIKVSIYTSANVFIEDWVYSTQYVIDSNNNVSVLSGYNIDNTKKMLIIREVEYTQENVYREGGDFPAKSTETSFDKSAMMCSQLAESIGRSLLLPEISSISGLSLPTPCAGKALKWNANEDGLINTTDDVDEIVTLATAQATIATTKASEASASASSASTSATSANNAATSAQASATSAANSVNGFQGVVDTATSVFNNNATTKTTAFNANATTKTNDFNANATAKQALVDSAATSAQASASSASTSATNAASSETNASTSATNASTNAQTATTQAGIATYGANVSINNANSSQINAQTASTKANESAASATASEASKVQSANYAAISKQYAIGEPTEPTEGSAKYWAEVAAQGQIQSDWNQADNTQKDYIKNKPTNLSQFTNDIDTLPNQAGNNNKFLKTDGTNASWAEIGGGMPIGSLLPLNCTADYIPDGCLPCDGTQYTKAQFTTLWTNYLTSSPVKLQTCTYAEYATSIATYGQCGKFAIDTTNNTFKVPTIKDGAVIQQALSNTELGKAYNAGLPNITGNLAHGGISTAEGCFEQGSSFSGVGANSQPNYYATFDASNSNAIYGNSTTVQMNAITARYFVVVANAQINQSQMDWSAWATSLAGKMNTDGTNATIGSFEGIVAQAQATGKETVVGWGMPDYTAGVSKSLNTPYTAPTIGYAFVVWNGSGSNSSQYLNINNINLGVTGVWGRYTGNAFIPTLYPLDKNDTYKLVWSGTAGYEPTIHFIPCKGA